MRATVSPAFPAVNGLITLIGLAGQVSAPAPTVAIERAIAAKDADNVRIDIMFCSHKSVTPRWRGAAALARRTEDRRRVSTKIKPFGDGPWMPQTVAVHCINDRHSVCFATDSGRKSAVAQGRTLAQAIYEHML